MIYNAGWDNLIPQERKYTPALAASAAKMLESGESLTATARAHNISRASLRNWSTTDPTLKKAFYTFEASKLKAEQERERVRHFKAVAKDIVDNARNGVADPVAQAVEKPTEQPTPREETTEQTRERSLQHWLETDWTPHFEAQQERAELEEIERQTEVQGFWVG